MEWASAPRLNPFVPLQVCHTDTMSGLYYTTTVHGPSWKQSALVYLYTALKSVNLLQDQNPRFSPSTAFFFWRLWKLLEWLRRPDKSLLVVAAFCVRNWGKDAVTAGISPNSPLYGIKTYTQGIGVGNKNCIRENVVNLCVPRKDNFRINFVWFALAQIRKQTFL